MRRSKFKLPLYQILDVYSIYMAVKNLTDDPIYGGIFSSFLLDQDTKDLLIISFFEAVSKSFDIGIEAYRLKIMITSIKDRKKGSLKRLYKEW